MTKGTPMDKEHELFPEEARLGVHRNTLIARLAAWGIRTGDRSGAAGRGDAEERAGRSGLV